MYRIAVNRLLGCTSKTVRGLTIDVDLLYNPTHALLYNKCGNMHGATLKIDVDISSFFCCGELLKIDQAF
jgi:hypothetical protein